MSTPASTRPVLLVAALALSLAGCTPPAPEAPASAPSAPASSTATTAPATAPADACDASKAQWAIGQSLDEALLERARVDAGARVVRSLKPGQMVTMEFNAERLNVDVDDNAIVTGVRCG
ncbi:I78 family peptidase inhibitor [Chiayiivirga flava]|uniref:Peptidase inhibitor I78 family protein n=1 Tax=Chiayiivirga flava TaxID=659595 RepID=A0A7W8G0S0_9GAMM|nr:I78 family peptidase inhibitor [Chiayiivirga flava]MBB5208073.1 hypothetical protein [Chiayiivirga flava]